MTLIEKVTEIFPNIKMQKKGVPLDICPSDLGYKNRCTHHDCKKCWAQKVENVKDQNRGILLISKLRNAFPDLKLMKDKTPNFCPSLLGYRTKCDGDCYKCWHTKRYKNIRKR